MTKEQRRMKNAVKFLQNYIKTYDKQPGYINYNDETFINDMLYGIGVALGDKYRFANGFDLFKKRLIEHLAGGENV